METSTVHTRQQTRQWIPVKRVFTPGLMLIIGGALLVILGVILICYGFPTFISNEIKKRIILEEGSEGYSMWKKLPFPLQFRVYIFNVTNPEYVTNGSKPILRELGPYIYEQYRTKEDIKFEGKDKVTYVQKKIFNFNKKMSHPLTEDDIVTVLNAPMMGLILMVNKMMPMMLSKVDEVLPQLFDSPKTPFLTAKVGDLLFGGTLINCTSQDMMVGAVCEGLRSRLPATMRPAPEPLPGYFFSFFSHMNDSAEGPYTVWSGAGDIGQLGQLVSFKNMSRLVVWDTESEDQVESKEQQHMREQCAKVKGSDSTIFPPIKETNIPKVIHIFQPDFCRTLFADYKGRRHSKGLPTVRYEAGSEVFASPFTNPHNLCYCPSDWSVTGKGCSLYGVQGLGPCQGTPVVVSYPHFYLASPILQDYIADGLHPDKHKHQTYIDIEPKTGTGIEGAKRIQMNMELAKLEGITLLESVNTGLMPILWIEEGAEVNDEVKELLESLYLKIKIVKVVQWIIVVCGGVMVLGGCKVGWRAGRGGGLGPSDSSGAGLRPQGAHGGSEGFTNRAFTLDAAVPHK